MEDEVIDGTQVTPPAGGRTFTQAELDEILTARLARESAKHTLELEAAKDDADNVRREARLRLAAAEGRSAESLEQRLAHEASVLEKDAQSLDRLRSTFGNVPGAGARAMKWQKEDPAGYRAARERYQVLAGIKSRPAEAVVDTSKFTKKQ
jgi:hypothetical protein